MDLYYTDPAQRFANTTYDLDHLSVDDLSDDLSVDDLSDDLSVDDISDDLSDLSLSMCPLCVFLRFHECNVSTLGLSYYGGP